MNRRALGALMVLSAAAATAQQQARERPSVDGVMLSLAYAQNSKAAGIKFGPPGFGLFGDVMAITMLRHDRFALTLRGYTGNAGAVAIVSTKPGEEDRYIHFPVGTMARLSCSTSHMDPNTRLPIAVCVPGYERTR